MPNNIGPHISISLTQMNSGTILQMPRSLKKESYPYLLESVQNVHKSLHQLFPIEKLGNNCVYGPKTMGLGQVGDLGCWCDSTQHLPSLRPIFKTMFQT